MAITYGRGPRRGFVETDADNQAHEWSADISLVKEGDDWQIDRMALNRQESAPEPAKEY